MKVLSCLLSFQYFAHKNGSEMQPLFSEVTFVRSLVEMASKVAKKSINGWP